MKKYLLAAMILGCSFTVFADTPNEKVLAAFNITFPNVENVKWSEGANTYQVNFKQGVITSRITYDKEGVILKTLRYYYQDQLPVMVLTKIKAKYPDKNIYGVIEESSEEGTIFHVTLEDEKTWTDIISDNYGTITVDKKFNKA